MADKKVLEWAEFSLKADMTEEALLLASDQLQKSFLEQQDGFLSRRLIRRGSEVYVDVLEWRDAAALDKAMQKVAASRECHKYFELMHIDPENPNGGMCVFDILKSYK